MKKDFDHRMKAKPAELKIGDNVLYKWPKFKVSNKTDTVWDPKPFKVTNVKNSLVTCERDGREMSRNSSMFKRFIAEVKVEDSFSNKQIDICPRRSERAKNKPDRLVYSKN